MPLATLRAREAVQFVVEQREQRIQRRTVSFAHGGKQSRNVLGRSHDRAQIGSHEGLLRRLQDTQKCCLFAPVVIPDAAIWCVGKKRHFTLLARTHGTTTLSTCSFVPPGLPSQPAPRGSKAYVSRRSFRLVLSARSRPVLFRDATA